jgi:hypothetical protein
VGVENLAERVARWSFTLEPIFAPDTPRDEGPCVVSPGMEASLATAQFDIRAKAPGGLGLSYVIGSTPCRGPDCFRRLREAERGRG